jgi:hypothetical protein
LIDRRSDEFASAGFFLKREHYFETYYVNSDTTTEQILLSEYPDTEWAQRLEIRNILAAIDEPEDKIAATQEFLDRHPQSPLTSDAYLIMGRAYGSIWSLQGTYRPVVAGEDSLAMEQIRMQSIKYLKLAFDGREELTGLVGSTDIIEGEIEAMESRGRISIWYFGD